MDTHSQTHSYMDTHTQTHKTHTHRHIHSHGHTYSTDTHLHTLTDTRHTHTLTDTEQIMEVRELKKQPEGGLRSAGRCWKPADKERSMCVTLDESDGYLAVMSILGWLLKTESIIQGGKCNME